MNRPVKLCLAALALCLGAISAFAADDSAIQRRESIGFLDQPSALLVNASEAVFSGWALSSDGIAAVDIVVDGVTKTSAKTGIIREDVRIARPGFPDSAAAGFDARVRLGNLDPDRKHEIEVVVTGKSGASTVLGHRTFVPAAFKARWADLLDERGRRPHDVFSFVFATSSLTKGGGLEVDTDYLPYVSRTVRIGIRVPILYLRTTKGRAGDWVFDPEFDTSRQCGTRRITEDSLNDVTRWSIEHQVPVLFTLNGGIWADAACDVPEWDINDFLEQDPLNCQWSATNEVMADDYLRHLPGSQDAPELARSLSFNVYAKSVRAYKKRNLQAAAKLIAEFATAHPGLFIGISLDPDVSVNSFFEGAQWYDYNPDTLRQFREWLRGAGPYRAHPHDAPVDLSRYRRRHPLTLAQVNAIAKAKFRKWDDVDPPRDFKTDMGIIRQPWTLLWEQFRRHLVGLHYDELSEWVTATGIAKEHVFSSQGFNAPGAVIGFEPFPIRLNSPAKGYDTGGVSVEGSVPRYGHLGAILYGASAANEIPMETPDSLFRVFRDFDPLWATVEYNTAALSAPAELPTLRRTYTSLRDVQNFGAQLLSPMAWNGSRASEEGRPGFASYTSFRGAPLERVTGEFLLSRANLPRQARYWGFGMGIVEEEDGWEAIWPAVGHTFLGGFTVTMAKNKAVLQSPPELDLRTSEIDLLVLNISKVPDDLTIAVDVRSRGKELWRRLAAAQPVGNFRRTKVGYLVALPHSSRTIEQMRLVLRSRSGSPIDIGEIVLYPAAAKR
ncbi:MAG: hypothetical protein ABIS68_02895 [Casimicrobiaceae bacterium]